MGEHIDIYGGGTEGRIFLAIDALNLVYMVIYNPIWLLALDALILVYMLVSNPSFLLALDALIWL